MNYLICFLIASNALTAALSIYFFLKNKKSPRTNSVELREFIGQLMNGNAILRIGVIDPGDLLLRTKRQ